MIRSHPYKTKNKLLCGIVLSYNSWYAISVFYLVIIFSDNFLLGIVCHLYWFCFCFFFSFVFIVSSFLFILFISHKRIGTMSPEDGIKNIPQNNHDNKNALDKIYRFFKKMACGYVKWRKTFFFVLFFSISSFSNCFVIKKTLLVNCSEQFPN